MERFVIRLMWTSFGIVIVVSERDTKVQKPLCLRVPSDIFWFRDLCCGMTSFEVRYLGPSDCKTEESLCLRPVQTGDLLVPWFLQL